MDDFNEPYMATMGEKQMKNAGSIKCTIKENVDYFVPKETALPRFPVPGERQGPSQLQILEDLIVDLDKAMNMDAVYHCMQKVRFLSAEIQSRGR